MLVKTTVAGLCFLHLRFLKEVEAVSWLRSWQVEFPTPLPSSEMLLNLLIHAVWLSGIFWLSRNLATFFQSFSKHCRWCQYEPGQSLLLTRFFTTNCPCRCEQDKCKRTLKQRSISMTYVGKCKRPLKQRVMYATTPPHPAPPHPTPPHPTPLSHM